jgi:hypothetical protein
MHGSTVSIAQTTIQKYHSLFRNVLLEEILFALYSKYKIIQIEYGGRVSSTPAPYSEGSGFKCRPRDDFLAFVVFLSPFRQIPR